MINQFIKWAKRRYAICDTYPDGKLHSQAVNSMPLIEVKKEAEKLLVTSENWEIESSKAGNEIDPNELGSLNAEFFARYPEIHANFMPLQLGYSGYPSWLPSDINKDFRIVGHTIENEFLLCRTHDDRVFEMALDDMDSPIEFELLSMYHAVVFYYRMYSSESDSC